MDFFLWLAPCRRHQLSRQISSVTGDILLALYGGLILQPLDKDILSGKMPSVNEIGDVSYDVKKKLFYCLFQSNYSWKSVMETESGFISLINYFYCPAVLVFYQGSKLVAKLRTISIIYVLERNWLSDTKSWSQAVNHWLQRHKSHQSGLGE